MAMPAAKRRWTAQEVRELIAENPLATPRYELVDGELLVTPSPNWPHQRAVKILVRELDRYLSRTGVGEVGSSPFDVELEANSVLQPDVFVVPTHESHRLLTAMPAHELLVAAEVLSASSGRHDRVTKRPTYQRHVPEYWVVDLDARLFERWRSADDRPDVLTEHLEWHPAGTTDPFRLVLPAYFSEVFHE